MCFIFHCTREKSSALFRTRIRKILRTTSRVMTASLLLAALGHPSPSSVAGGGEVAAASAVAWLEDAAVRALPAGDRGPLRDVESPAWPATFEQARGARERRHATRVCACSRKREVSARRAHAAASVSSRLTRLSPSTCVRLSALCGRRRAPPPSTGCSATRWGWCTTTMVRARRLSQAAGGRHPSHASLTRPRFALHARSRRVRAAC